MLYVFGGVALFGLALLAIGYRLSRWLLSPPRQGVSRTPEEFGLGYEDVGFTSKDGLSLKGWWIPATPDPRLPPSRSAPVAILLHPMFGNRLGSSRRSSGAPSDWTGDLDLLKVACRFHASGFAVLLFDFRNHGESDAGLCAGGYTEDQDVVGAVDYVFRRVAAEAPDRQPRVGLAGFGIGASAAISAIGRVKGDDRTIRVFSADNENATGLLEFRPANVKKLRFLVAVEPGSLRTLLYWHLRRVSPLLDWLLVPVVSRFCYLRSGYPLDSHLLIQFARHVYNPTLYVQGCRGRWRGGDEVRRLYEATPGPKQLWANEDRPDGGLVPEPPSALLARVVTFAQECIGASAVVTGS